MSGYLVRSEVYTEMCLKIMVFFGVRTVSFTLWLLPIRRRALFSEEEEEEESSFLRSV
jgi:hypothetical protein